MELLNKKGTTMSKQVTTGNVERVQIVNVEAYSLGAFIGMLFALFGFVAAVLYTFSSTVSITQATDSLLQGLTFGIARGIFALLIIPMVYFVFGFVLGYLYGVIFNAVSKSTGGIVIDTVKKKE